MADPSLRPASFWTQANALLRKNVTYQKRNVKKNIRFISFNLILCILFAALQAIIYTIIQLDKSSNNCDAPDLVQAATCPIANPLEWTPLLQVPAPENRAVRTDFLPYTDLPNDSCRSSGSCPATFLFTGNNQSLGEILAENMVLTSHNLNASDAFDSLATGVSGSDTYPATDNFLDPAFFSGVPIYNVQSQCSSNSTVSVSFLDSSIPVQEAYDFLNSNGNNFNVSIWFNSTYKNYSDQTPIALVWVSRSVNLASNAYIQFLRGPGTKIIFEFVKEMPKHETILTQAGCVLSSGCTLLYMGHSTTIPCHLDIVGI